jgi:hypothetical protein
LKIRRKILPDQPGAKAWKEKYGKNLVCVRYRYDEEQNKRLTTIEIIVNEKYWEKKSGKIPPNKIVPVIVMYSEVRTADLIKKAGGRWNREEKVWELPYRDVLSLGLEDRIIKPGGGRKS